jgi:hypothetical protein
LLPEPSDDFEKKVFRKSQSLATLKFYRTGRKKFEQFCKRQFGKDLATVTQTLKEGGLDLYRFVDGYVEWLVGQGLKPKTVGDYVQGAKKLLRFHDIPIINETFLEKVTLPKVEEILD